METPQCSSGQSVVSKEKTSDPERELVPDLATEDESSLFFKMKI